MEFNKTIEVVRDEVIIPKVATDDECLARIKKFCFICKFSIPKRTIKQYRKKGNTCDICLGRIKKATKKVNKEKSQQLKATIDFMLATRIVEVSHPNISCEDRDKLVIDLINYWTKIGDII